MSTGRRFRWRWLLGAVIAVFVLLAIVGYERFTDPARLRAQTLAALRALSVGGVDVGDVSFTPWGGLKITDLAIHSGEATGVPAAGWPRSIDIASTRIRCGLWALLGGRIEPRRVEMSAASIVVFCGGMRAGAESPSASFEAGARRISGLLAAWKDRLPPIRVENADLQFMVAEQGRARLIERRLVDVTGQPTSAGYRVRVDSLPTPGRPVAELEWSAAARELALMLDWTDLETIGRVLPARAAAELERWKLAGRARVARLKLCESSTGATATDDPSKPLPGLQLTAADLSLSELTGVVPLEEVDADAASSRTVGRRGESSLRLTSGTATINYRNDDPNGRAAVEVGVDGRLNDAPMKLSLAADADWIAELSIPREPTRRDAAPHPHFDLESVIQADLSIAGIELPTAESQPAFVGSARLPHALRSAFNDYRPRGRVSVHMRILPREAGGADDAGRVTAEIEALGATCRYRHFPYDFQDVRGRLNLTQGRVYLDGLAARHGAAQVWTRGTVHGTREWVGLDLEFRAQNLPLDQDLYAALPDPYRQLWKRAAPLGRCDAVATLRRADGSEQTGPLPAEVHVDAHLLGGSLSLGDGRRLTDADGWLTVQGGVVQVHDLQGYEGDAAVRLAGRLAIGSDDVETDLHVEATNYPVQEQAALTSAPDGSGERVRFQGRADVWGRVLGSGSLEPQRQDLTVEIKGGELWAFDPARRWTDVTGWVLVHDDRRQIVALACRQGDATFVASGVLPNPSQPPTPLRLVIRVQTPTVESLIPQFVPADWRSLAERLGLTGRADVSVRLRPGEGENEAGQQRVEIQLDAARMRPPPRPLELREITGYLTLAPGRFEVPSASGRWGETGSIQAQGGGTWHGEDVQVEMSARATGLKFGPELDAALPEPVQRILARLAVRGGFDALLDRVVVSGGPARTWVLDGRLPLRDLALRLGLDLTDARGELAGTCVLDPNGDVELDAAFVISEGRLAGRPIAGWHGQLVHRAGEEWVQLDELAGQLCGGQARGSVLVDPSTAEYELSLTLRDVSAHELLPPPKDQPEHPRRGRMDGSVYLRGRGSEVGSRRGGGDLRLRGASFLQTPVLASVFRAEPLGLRSASETMERADVRFLWEGSQVRLQRVEINSRDLRFVGEGTWDMRDDSVRLTLVGARPQDWPRLEMVSDLIELAGKELVQYRVEGTLAAPKVTTQPLHRLDDALRKLIREGLK